MGSSGFLGKKSDSRENARRPPNVPEPTCHPHAPFPREFIRQCRYPPFLWFVAMDSHGDGEVGGEPFGRVLGNETSPTVTRRGSAT